MDRIRQLEQEVYLWQDKVKQAEEEMRFYKLELINREDNFNQKFSQGGSQGMSVGVMDPLSFGKAKYKDFDQGKTKLPAVHNAQNSPSFKMKGSPSKGRTGSN
jgi:hypothetical protein